MDTYASSAGDPGGFYDIPALAPAVDGFFVMAYQLNLQSPTNPASPLTSSMFSDLTTAQQYAAAVPPSKVILGVPFYGEQWPTTNGTMSAQATGTATPVSDAQIVAGGHPAYWDDVTQTAWTSYQSGGQWYEEYYEDPASLYLIAQTSQLYDLGGVGAWALGMDGNDPQMLAALDGFAPASKATPAGPPSASPTASTTTTSTTTAPAPPTGSTTTTSTTTPTGSTTTSSPGTSDGAAPRYSGTWEGQTVSLSPAALGDSPVARHAGVHGATDRVPDQRPRLRLPLHGGGALGVGLRVVAHRRHGGGRTADGLRRRRVHLRPATDTAGGLGVDDTAAVGVRHILGIGERGQAAARARSPGDR